MAAPRPFTLKQYKGTINVFWQFIVTLKEHTWLCFGSSEALQNAKSTNTFINVFMEISVAGRTSNKLTKAVHDFMTVLSLEDLFI